MTLVVRDAAGAPVRVKAPSPQEEPPLGVTTASVPVEELPAYEEPLFEEDDGLIFPMEIWRSLEGAQGCMQCSSCHGCR